MKILAGLAVMAALHAVDAEVTDVSKGGVKGKSSVGERQTEERRRYLENYCKYRVIALNHFKLSHDSTLEELRPHMAHWLDLPKDAAWTSFENSKFIQRYVKRFMTEERREKFSQSICGRSDATWVEMLYALEDMRKKRDAKKTI